MPEAAKNIRILIVDDEERLLRILRLGLKPRGFEVVTVNNAEDAVNKICDEPFDIVLTDIRMEKMSGVELVYEVERLKINVPIIVMTAFADVGSAVKSLKHGARDYIQKPFTVDELEKVIRELLESVSNEKTDKFLTLDEGVSQKEKELVMHALQRSGGVKAQAAKLLQISERTLWYKLKKYNLQ